MAKPRNWLKVLIVVVTLVVVWLAAFGGAAYIASLLQPTPSTPAGTLAVTGANMVVTGGATSVSDQPDQHRTLIQGSNAGLAGVTSIAFRLSVRDASGGAMVGKGFTMTITAGTFQSSGGGNFPVVPYKGSSTCYDASLGTASGGSMTLSCNDIIGSITTSGGAVSATLTASINGNLWGVGAPPAGQTVSIVFHIANQADYSVVFETSG